MSNTKIIDKKIKQLQQQKKDIEKSNKMWKTMSAAEKRVAIAKDVIAQIKSGYLKPEHESYVNLPEELGSDPDNQLSCELKNMPYCTVCARGAIFVSAVKRFNNKVVGDYYNESYLEGTDIFPYEKKFFTVKQIQLIEHVFEDSEICGLDSNALSNKEIKACQNYRKTLGDSAKSRMVGIMKNIIKNNGEFVVPKEFFE